MKPEIIAAQRERPKIERKFAELKRFHGLKEAVISAWLRWLSVYHDCYRLQLEENG